MIRINPAWEGEKAADIQALYNFLLYKTLPFRPSAYLPRDENGFYYYENGDRHTSRIYTDEPYIKWNLHRSSQKFLNTYQSVISKYCKATSTVFRGRNPKSTEELIYLVSEELHNMLYDTDQSVLRVNLQKLLTVVPNQETVEAMDFSLNPGLLEEAKKQFLCSKKFQQKLRNMLYTEVFNYDLFSKNDSFPKLVQLLGVAVCPYCNRTFTTTVQKKDGSYHRQNQVDHYAPKSLYPWFALSLANFIPACGNCNQKKSSKGGFVLYPYEESFGEAYRFRSVPVSGIGYLIGQPAAEDEFRITIEKAPGISESEDLTYANYRKRVQNSIERLGLDVLYQNSHNAYVAGIYEQRYVFGDPYIDSLIASFPQLFNSRADVRRLIYLKEFNNDALNKAPLSKLTHDIDAEITRLSE